MARKAPFWLERTRLLLGDRLERLRQAHIWVVGLGGVGGMACESLCRAGVGQLTLVDADRVEMTNLNRQILATRATLGRQKTDAMQERLRSIVPGVSLNLHPQFLTSFPEELILAHGKPDLVLDAIDSLAPKTELILGCLERSIPVFSALGAGARMDPSAIRSGDISETRVCPLARALRKRLHRRGVRSGFQVVYSVEPPDPNAVELLEGAHHRSRTGNISTMPGLFGLHLASLALHHLLEGQKTARKTDPED